jgi:hypothetical protein
MLYQEVSKICVKITKSSVADPGFTVYPGSRIGINKFSKIRSGMFIPDSGSGFFFHPESRIQGLKSTGPRIRIRNTEEKDALFTKILNLAD